MMYFKEKVRILLFAAFAAFAAFAESLKVACCERDPNLDYWAKSDIDFSAAVMHDVLTTAGLEHTYLAFGDDGYMDVSNADVICSAFRTKKLLEEFDFPLQPLCRMHFALYATPSRAKELLSSKITDWPSMRIGYSPVSQGQISNDDREKYFESARLSPAYVEIPTSVGAVEALHKGEIDALFLYTPFGRRPEGVVEVVPIGSRNVYFGVNKKNPELLKKLTSVYRTCYIDHVDLYDELRERYLGIPKPDNRVRVAAYTRGDIFDVSPDGERSGALEIWMKTIVDHTRWKVDFVYGNFDDCVADVMSGRLDIIGGVSMADDRRGMFYYPHMPMGMIRTYLWTRPHTPYKPGRPETWHGMRVGLLASTVSAKRARRQFDEDESIECVEFSSDSEMLAAYFKGDIDACVDVETAKLKDEKALSVYSSSPMYICTSLHSRKVFEELEDAMYEMCDNFPKYIQMISEHHYGIRTDTAAFTIEESSWLAQRVKDKRPIVIDFSPWPFPVVDGNGVPTGFVRDLLAGLSGLTGLNFAVAPQTDMSSAAAKFLRGDTDLWIPYPEKASAVTYAATSVFSANVPQAVAQEMGVNDQYQTFDLFARQSVPKELVSILGKAMAIIDVTRLQEMFMADSLERQVAHRMFGMSFADLKSLVFKIAAMVLIFIIVFGAVMLVLLKKQTRRANLAAAAAEKHAKDKARFLAMMSHELRTPLNAVVGFAEFLSHDNVDDKLRREYTDGILLSSNALLELVNDILDLSKLEAGAMDMRFGTCEIGQLMKELPAIFGARLRRNGVNLRIDLGDKPPPVVKLYQQGMRQVLINLVGNAAKFTEKGEIAVLVRWFGESSTLHVEVSDTGCGISNEKMAKLFDPYVQDIATRMKTAAGAPKGTGLGLPIVKRMIESAGGAIAATSEFGSGTKFIIDIPDLEVVGPAHSDARPTLAALMSTLPQRVLVVDDMPVNRKVLGIHLKNLGVADIRFAENGVNALDAMEGWIPDVVLTDMWMPEMDGTHLAEAMRDDKRFARIPVVAVTADAEIGSTCDPTLFAKIISKPVTSDKLKALFGRK